MLEVTLSGLLLTVNYANDLCDLSVFEGLPAMKENRELYQFETLKKQTNSPPWRALFCLFTSTLTYDCSAN